jgi:hypothetical protein
MAESFGNEFTLVEVTTDDLVGAKTRLWVAAAKPSQAVTLVLTRCQKAGQAGSRRGA